MKKFFLIGATLLFSLYASAQHVALKNNIIYDATATPNLGLEVGLGKKVTMDLSAGYNPFEFSNDKQAKHWLAHAGVRFWFTHWVASTTWQASSCRSICSRNWKTIVTTVICMAGALVSAINGYYPNAGESKPRSVQVMPACITTNMPKAKICLNCAAATTITGE